MKLQINLLLFVSSLAFLFIFSDAALGSGRTGGWTRIKDINDSHLTDVGKFAVTEYNKKSKTSLKFSRVVSGESQVVAGTNYKLIVAVNDGKVVKNYEAVVYERSWENYISLTSFKLVK